MNDTAEERDVTILQRVLCLCGKHDWEMDPLGAGHVVRCARCGKTDWSFIP